MMKHGRLIKNGFEWYNHFMDETKLNWDDLRLFLAVARHKGLHAAAKATGKSPPTLGRRMLTLEQGLGLDLFQRLPRGYELTTDGVSFLHKIRQVEASLDPILEPRSHVVKVSAGSWMTQALCTRADELVRNDVQLHFIAADHKLDIARREAVIGIRNKRPEQRGLACRKVGQVHFAGYAHSPDLPWIKVSGQTPSAQWLADQTSSLTVSAPRNALDLAVAGQGIALLPTFIGEETPLTRTFTVPELTHDQWLVSHETARFDPQVRQIIDRLYDVLDALHRNANTNSAQQ